MANTKLPKTEEEWKKKLTPEEFRVLREKCTELPFTGKYNLHKEKGMYVCTGCGTELFSSGTKFDSHCGWPAFFAGISRNIETREDDSFGMHRIEVLCKKCTGHLGHLFDDGPKDKGGMRYCINSVSLDFQPSVEKSRAQRADFQPKKVFKKKK